MIPVIDLFAGPGGLGEGFSSLRDAENKPVFQTIMSIERDKQAHQTLRLRSYLRKIAEPDGTLPRVYLRYMKKHNNETFDQLIRYRPKNGRPLAKKLYATNSSMETTAWSNSAPNA